MITYTTSPLAAPFVLVLWTIDSYAFAVVARMVLSRLRVTRNATVTRALREIVDPLANTVDRWTQGRTNHPAWNWAWAILFGGLLIARFMVLQILLWIGN